MPFINIRVKGPVISAEQGARIREKATGLLVGILGKKLERIACTLEQDPTTGWSIGGKPVAFAAHLEATVMTGSNTADEKQRFVEQSYALLREELGADLPVVTFVVVREAPGDSWGFGGSTNAHRAEYKPAR
jgi:4-oxalocrotonate tautomerase